MFTHLAIDLESDGQAIHQLGLCDERGPRLLETQASIEDELARISDRLDELVLIGHNIRAWDVALLQRVVAGWDSSRVTLVDTLELAALIFPFRDNLALAATHRADEDARLAWRLYHTGLSLLPPEILALATGHAVLPDPAAGLAATNEERFAFADSLLWPEQDPPCQCRSSKPEADRPGAGRKLLMVPTGWLRSIASRSPLRVLAHHRFRPPLDEDPRTEWLRLRAADRGCLPDPGALHPVSRPLLLDSNPETGRGLMHFGQPAERNDLVCTWRDLFRPGASRVLAECDAKRLVLVDVAQGELESERWLEARSLEEVESRAPVLADLIRFNRPGSLLRIPLLALGDWLDQVEEIERDCGYAWLSIETGGRCRPMLRCESLQDHLAALLPEVGFDELATNTADRIRLKVLLARQKVGDAPDDIGLAPDCPNRRVYWRDVIPRLLEAWRDNDNSLLLLVLNAGEAPAVRSLLEKVAGSIHVMHDSGPAMLRRLSERGKRLAVAPVDELHSLAACDMSRIRVAIEGIRDMALCDTSGLFSTERSAAEPNRGLDAVLVETEGPSEGDVQDTRPAGSRTLARRSLNQWLEWLASGLSLLQKAGASSYYILDPRGMALPQPFAPVSQPVDPRDDIPEEWLSPFRTADLTPGKDDNDWQERIEAFFLAGRGVDGRPGQLRDEQVHFLEPILERRNEVYISLPTGGGKSILFQGPALLEGLASGRMSLVVAPLKALMNDQVASLWEKGLVNVVEAITGDLDRFELTHVYQRLASGTIWLLYVAPERFRSRRFRKALDACIARSGVAFWVFDEAHCLSQWGLDFRPDYHFAATEIRQLAADAVTQSPRLFFSATMSAQVRQDIEEMFHG